MCQRHKRWGVGCRAWEKGDTNGPHHSNIFGEKQRRSLILTHTHIHTHICKDVAGACTEKGRPSWPAPFGRRRAEPETVYTESDTLKPSISLNCYFSRLNTPFLWSHFSCPRACKYYAHNLEILTAKSAAKTSEWLLSLPRVGFFGLSHTDRDHLDEPLKIQQ